ncbi:MAG: amino acid permease [Acidobacteria bacterium]|nr:amino acid permease [Acidobacteriota bacterium]
MKETAITPARIELSDPSAGSGPGLARELGLLDATMISVGTIIGSGIFIVPASIALYLQFSSLALGVWVVGGLVTLLGALSIAELGAAMPAPGGQFVYLRKAYGPFWGFLYGWTTFTVINTASIATVAVAFATYVGYFVPLGVAGIRVVAIGSIAALTAINCLGVRHGATTQNLLTFLKIGSIFALIGASFLLRGGSFSNFSPVLPTLPVTGLAGPLALAMVAALWAYDGWIEVTYVAGEVKEPQRNIPLSLLYSTVLAALRYLLINFSYIYVLSLGKMSRSELVASDTATVLLGRYGATLVSLAVLVSTLGANNGFILTGARIYYAMAREGLFFDWVSRVHPRFRTPVPSLVVQGVWSALLTLTGTFSQLFTYVIFAGWIFYAMSCGAVLILRRRAAEMPRPYHTWGYPAAPVVFILFAVWLVVSTVIHDPRDAGIGAGIMLTGLPAYYYWSRKKK